MMTEILASSMTVLASFFDGSIGWAIVALALSVRLALLPLTLHLSRKMVTNQKKIKSLQPEVDAIKKRFAGDPKKMFAAMSALYKENGAHMIDRSSVFGALAQWPVFLLMYKAISNAAAGNVSFLWIRSIAAPDAILTAIVLVLTAVAAYYAPTAADSTTIIVMIQVVITAFVIWQLSAGIGLYWVASAAVGVVQTGILRCEQGRRKSTVVHA